MSEEFQLHGYRVRLWVVEEYDVALLAESPDDAKARAEADVRRGDGFEDIQDSWPEEIASLERLLWSRIRNSSPQRRSACFAGACLRPGDHHNPPPSRPRLRQSPDLGHPGPSRARLSALGGAAPTRAPRVQDQDLRMPSCLRLRPRRRRAFAVSVARRGSRDRERPRRRDRTGRRTGRGIVARGKLFASVRSVSREVSFLRILALIAGLALVSAGCAGGSGPKSDTAAARRFAAFPLYWVGPSFERWKLATIQGLDRPREFVSFIYGRCTPRGEEQPSCAPPFEIQIFPLCRHLDVVAAAPVWKLRHIRGAPVGRNPDGAPVLFSRRTQVKVYRGEGSDAGLPLRVLRALRSINRVSPTIGPRDTIDPPPAGVLEGRKPCTG